MTKKSDPMSYLSPTEQDHINAIIKKKLDFINTIDRFLDPNYKPKPEKKKKRDKKIFVCGRNFSIDKKSKKKDSELEKFLEGDT